MPNQPDQPIIPCCALYDSICSRLPICVVIQDFWETELANPISEREATIGDLVILDRNLETTHKNFFGIIINRSASIITAFTPGFDIVKKPSITTQKIRLNEGSTAWRDYLLLTALKREVITYAEEELENSSNDSDTEVYDANQLETSSNSDDVSEQPENADFEGIISDVRSSC